VLSSFSNSALVLSDFSALGAPLSAAKAVREKIDAKKTVRKLPGLIIVTPIISSSRNWISSTSIEMRFGLLALACG
jgi:hypothetical protein